MKKVKQNPTICPTGRKCAKVHYRRLQRQISTSYNSTYICILLNMLNHKHKTVQYILFRLTYTFCKVIRLVYSIYLCINWGDGYTLISYCRWADSWGKVILGNLHVVCYNHVAKRSRINDIQYNTPIAKCQGRTILLHYQRNSIVISQYGLNSRGMKIISL